ncbi:isochorismate synthase [Natrialbaceae archaeon A-gly3]
MDRASGEKRRAREGSDVPLWSRSRELTGVAPKAVFDVAETPRVLWTSPDGLEVAGCGAVRQISATGGDRFETVRETATERLAGLSHDGPDASRPRAFGGLSFHACHEPSGTWKGFEAAAFVVPEVQVTRTDEGTWLTGVGESEAEATETLERVHGRLSGQSATDGSAEPPGIEATREATGRERWIDGVENARERIARGDIEKVVLAEALTADLEEPLDLAATVGRLGERYPNCYRFAVDPGAGKTFFGAPPERLVALRGRQVLTEALAGSIERGETPEDDDTLFERMAGSEKYQHEHGLVAQVIRDQLEPLSNAVSVGEQTVRRLATIQHLLTPIEATLDADRHVLEVVEALHPTPAVGGVPLEGALETIRETERFERGWYAAPIGWFDADGDGEFAVGIRSGVASGESVTLFAGNGIVADSDPDTEWEEVNLKFRPILDELR